MMSDKLQRDLEIAETMAGEMDAYLPSNVLFWPLMKPNMPRLTLGGYLMRQYRLVVLHDHLPLDDQTRLRLFMDQFRELANEHLVRVEQKADQELQARIRQWTEFLRDLRDDQASRSRAFYATGVETRVMIAAVVNWLQMPPYQLNERVPAQLRLLDNQLRANWQEGEFIWQEGWQKAYPLPDYWWLYGLPR